MSANRPTEARPTETCSTAAICEELVELLPWLINGSITGDCRGRLTAHLEACENCRLELDEAYQAWQIMGRHVPSLVLAQYAHGQTPDDLDRDGIERHLEFCPSCKEEIELMRSDRMVEFPAARVSPAARVKRATLLPRWSRRIHVFRSRPIFQPRLAIAASLAAVLAVGGLFGLRGLPLGERAGTVLIGDRDGRQADSLVASVTSKATVDAGGIFANGFEQPSLDDWAVVNNPVGAASTKREESSTEISKSRF